MSGGTGPPRDALSQMSAPRGPLRPDTEAQPGSGGLVRQGTMRNLGALEGGLPDAGAIIALADVETNRVYVAMESEDGSLVLELSELSAGEELRNPDSAVRLVFRRLVRLGGCCSQSDPASLFACMRVAWFFLE